ncbi:MAG: hypothetical protein ACRDRW_13390 [Pseudonocardiaceae bacterium]
MCAVELLLRTGVDRSVRACRAAFADGSLTMITGEPQLEDCARHVVRGLDLRLAGS